MLSLSWFGARKRVGASVARPTADDSAFARRAAVDAFLPAIDSYVRRRVRDPDAASDIVAQAFADAFSAWNRAPRSGLPTDEHDPLRAWLFTIARRRLADHHEANKRDGERRAPDLSETISSNEPSPEAKVIQSESSRTLRSKIDALPPPQREALLLKYADGLSVGEIASVLGKSPDAVASLLQRAKTTLRATISEENFR